MLVFYAIRQGLLEGLRESLAASRPDHYELTAAVIAASAQNAAKDWLAGNDIFENARLVPANAGTSANDL
jgi:hypothetical protein